MLIDTGLGKVDSLEKQKIVFEKDIMLNWKPVEFFILAVTDSFYQV